MIQNNYDYARHARPTVVYEAVYPIMYDSEEVMFDRNPSYQSTSTVIANRQPHKSASMYAATSLEIASSTDTETVVENPAYAETHFK